MSKKIEYRHCQCCGRRIGASAGVIAHHGYTRPAGWYQQVGSCRGSRSLPFEASKAELERMIESWKGQGVNMAARIAKVEAFELPVLLHYSVRSDGWGGKREERALEVTAETWEALKAEHIAVFRQWSWYSFAEQHQKFVKNLKFQLKQLNEAVAEQEARAAGWKQVEKWNHETKKWEAV